MKKQELSFLQNNAFCVTRVHGQAHKVEVRGHLLENAVIARFLANCMMTAHHLFADVV